MVVTEEYFRRGKKLEEQIFGETVEHSFHDGYTRLNGDPIKSSSDKKKDVGVEATKKAFSYPVVHDENGWHVEQKKL